MMGNLIMLEQWIWVNRIVDGFVKIRGHDAIDWKPEWLLANISLTQVIWDDKIDDISKMLMEPRSDRWHRERLAKRLTKMKGEGWWKRCGRKKMGEKIVCEKNIDVLNFIFNQSDPLIKSNDIFFVFHRWGT